MRLPRRARVLPLLACLLCVSRAIAEDNADELRGSARDRAIERGLTGLRQQIGPGGAVGSGQRTALTALATLAHLANGITPSDEQHGTWLTKAIDFVVSSQDEDGYFGRGDGSRMYGHGIATLMLAQAMGECGDDAREARVRSALMRAVALTLRAQQIPKRPPYRGGWRYQPNDTSSDLSLSGWQLLSLHACRQIGMAIPEQAIADGSAYARSLIGEHGEVGYERRGEDRPGLRGLALLVLTLGRPPVGPPPLEQARIAARITEDPQGWQGGFFFYRAYYDALGLARGAPATWSVYGPRLERLLLEHQAADGTWSNPPGGEEGAYGPVYSTSMALLSLSVSRHLLPAHHF
jgi:hypothetical protein